MLSFMTFGKRGASKYFDNFEARTGISSCPHDFLESNPLMSASISSGVVGCKKDRIHLAWGNMFFRICISSFRWASRCEICLSRSNKTMI